MLAISPVLLKESRADLDHRHFDAAGAASITGGLMLLVYALTRASQHGWATTQTIGLLVASTALVLGFVVIEMRSPAPLLPLRIFRLRTLTASNITPCCWERRSSRSSSCSPCTCSRCSTTRR